MYLLAVVMCMCINLFLFYIQNEKCVAGSKPCLIFTGDYFETDENYKRLKNLLIGMLCVCVISKQFAR